MNLEGGGWQELLHLALDLNKIFGTVWIGNVLSFFGHSK
jgi:hypothetical protein